MNVTSAFFFSRIPSQLVAIALIVLSSCGNNDDPEPPALPQVTAISPTSGVVNTSVLITGTNFSTVLAENKVTFDGKEGTITVATGTQLTVTVPMDAETGPVSVKVKDQEASNKPVFTVESLKPEVTKLSPASGMTNTPVVISGTKFSTVLAENKVTFNGKEAVVTTATNTQLTVTVPTGAETGPVSVKVKDQEAMNKPVFTVESPAPEVTKLTPAFGLTNTPVVISGANFSTVLADNKVTFNGKEAVVTASTPTLLTVTVPLLSETGPVIVSVKGKPALNQPVFAVMVIPVLTTSAVSDIIITTAVGGGTITSEGGSPVTARGICWSTGPSPTTLNSKTVNGSGLGTFTSSITGLTLGITYYVRAYATNTFGTAYGNEVTLKSLPAVGAKYQEGIIAYIFQPGEPGYVAGESHGLIAATEDQGFGASIAWAPNNDATGAKGTALGTGAANTIAIVGSPDGPRYAALACYDLRLGIYEDWFLPSKDELNKLYLARNVIGNFSTGYYWSSTEASSDAWIQNFSNGIQSTYSKKASFHVRAVRVF